MSKERMGMFTGKGITPEVSVHKETAGYLWRCFLYPVTG